MIKEKKVKPGSEPAHAVRVNFTTSHPRYDEVRMADFRPFLG